MEGPVRIIDSASVGEPDRFRSLDDLERGLREGHRSPRDHGRVAWIIRRGAAGAREVLDRVRLSPEEGIPGDAWGRKEGRDPQMQIAVMEVGVAELIANGQPLTLFGDGFLLELDLSADNLPQGSRVAIGDAVLEVTPMPHNGCRKFLARFGQEALRFVSQPELRHRNLRGIYLRVVTAGEVGRGDSVRVLRRGDR